MILEELVVSTHGLLRELNATVAVAESLTGGLISAALTEPSGASDVVRGGVVVYATALKSNLVGVDMTLLERVGAVDPLVAAQLAIGASTRLDATFGLAATGVAGPTEQDGKPVGTVYLAVSGPRGVTTAHEVFAGSRHEIRRQSVESAVSMLHRECARWRSELHSS
jgi:PncC family amidohydrolase